MPGGYGTSGPWGSAGETYTTPSSPSSGGNGGGGGGGNQEWANEFANIVSAPSVVEDTTPIVDIYKEMADKMSEVGQISGGLGGGTYTKGPVVYPKEFYTHEGWSEVQKKGWSDKLYQGKIQGRTPSEWILDAEKPQDVGGGLTTLPEGILYSSNIGDPGDEDFIGYGGTIRTPLFVPPGGDNDGQSYDYGSGYDPGGGGGGYGGGSMAGVHPRSFYKGLPYQDFSGKEVHKMLDFDQKVEAANILSGLSQGAQAFAMDPKARGILAVLQA